MFGALASAASQGGQVALTLGYIAILARLITPNEFGLVAMAGVVAGFLQVFKDAGLSTATIQREHITNAQVSNLFWINLAAGVVAMLAMAGTAPLLARFFREPELVAISMALSVGFLLEALVVQPLAILNRQMRFKAVSGLEFGCTASGFAVGVLMALTGWRYWSLIGATLSTSVFRNLSVWTLSRWRPQRPSRRTGTRHLVRFGADLTLVGVVYALSRGCDSLLIGRYLGSDAVGLYNRATVLLTRPIERLTTPIYTVIVPALSRLQNEPARYRTAFLRAFEALAIVAFFITGLLFPLASDLVRLVLGDRWDGVAPIFGALSFAAAYLLLGTATSWLFTSQARGRDLLVTSCGAAAIMVAAFVIGLPFGATGVAIGYSLATVVGMLPLIFYMAGRRGPVSTTDLWRAVVSHVPVFMTVVGANWLTRAWLADTMPLVPRLGVCLTIGATAGIMTLWCSERGRGVLKTLVGHLEDLRLHRWSAPS